ncbi:hypothetical protein LXL04_037226 [Taraxacum kok-saghyz]
MSFREKLITVRFWQVPKSRFWNFPVRLLPERSRNFSDEFGPRGIKPVGISPERKLFERSRYERYMQLPRELGRLPASLLPEKLSVIKFRQFERETDKTEESERKVPGEVVSGEVNISKGGNQHKFRYVKRTGEVHVVVDQYHSFMCRVMHEVAGHGAHDFGFPAPHPSCLLNGGVTTVKIVTTKVKRLLVTVNMKFNKISKISINI